MKKICEIKLILEEEQTINGVKLLKGSYVDYVRDFDPNIPGSSSNGFEKIIDKACEYIEEGRSRGITFTGITIRFGTGRGEIGDGDYDIMDECEERTFQVNNFSEEFEMMDFVYRNLFK